MLDDVDSCSPWPKFSKGMAFILISCFIKNQWIQSKLAQGLASESLYSTNFSVACFDGGMVSFELYFGTSSIR